MDVQLIPFTFFGTMRLTGDFKKIRKNEFLRAFVVSSCRKSGFRVLLSLRYGADLGRSRLIAPLTAFKMRLFDIGSR